MEFETLEELVKQRKGYKCLSKDGRSPYQEFSYDLSNKKEMINLDLDENINNDCGPGWNLATLKWIADECLKLDGIILECSIPKRGKIIVPKNSNGKFRTDIIKIKKVHKVPDLFPHIKDFEARLKVYKAINPITATKIPPIDEIKKIMAQVRAQVWDQVRAQVGAQCYICGYNAIVDFLKLNFNHPSFDLIRLGILVVKVKKVFKVFGKNGVFLGEFDE